MKSLAALAATALILSATAAAAQHYKPIDEADLPSQQDRPWDPLKRSTLTGPQFFAHEFDAGAYHAARMRHLCDMAIARNIPRRERAKYCGPEV